MCFASMKPFILLAFTIGTAALQAKVQVDADFPGGSIIVEELDPEKRLLRFRPMNHKGKGWACWWYFKVSGLTSGEVWKLSLNGSEVGVFQTLIGFALTETNQVQDGIQPQRRNRVAR